MAEPLDGCSAVVTGGTRGIGAAIAARLLEQGATVTVSGARAGGAGPGTAAFRAVDFTDRIATAAFASELTAAAPDILINNAGINVVAPFAEIDPDDFDRILDVNVRAPFLLCRAVVPAMRRKGWGRIVNIGSVFGTISKERRGSYSASKFALDGLTAALAAEVAADGVLVNCVSPGFVDTELTHRVLGDAGIAELVARVPARRLARPEEIAHLVVWLCGPGNTYVSGQNLVIDGGFTRV